MPSPATNSPTAWNAISCALTAGFAAAAASSAGQRLQPALDERLERPGYRKRLPGASPAAAGTQRGCQFLREERVAARRLVHRHHLGPAIRRAALGAEQGVEILEAEGPDEQRLHPFW